MHFGHHGAKGQVLKHFYVHLEAACILDQFIQSSAHSSHWSHFWTNFVSFFYTTLDESMHADERLS